EHPNTLMFLTGGINWSALTTTMYFFIFFFAYPHRPSIFPSHFLRRSQTLKRSKSQMDHTTRNSAK
ncbi:hypothetical protein PJP10_32135, partial [Mycobacterium kansasii]